MLRLIEGIGAAEFMVAEVVHPEALEGVRQKIQEALLVVAEVAVHPAVAVLLLL